MNQPPVATVAWPHQRSLSPSWQRRGDLLLLLALLLVAAGLRLWRLDGVPPGFTHDEAGHGHDAIAILGGARPIYQTVGYGREPLYDYWVAGLMALLGATGRVLRLSPVPLGLVTLLLTFLWVRRAFDGLTALAAVALQAASFWSLSVSRQALRSALLPALFTGAVYCFWRFYVGPGRFRPWFAGLFALLLAATFYTYVPARVLWAVFPAFVAYLALLHRTAFRHAWRPALLAVALALLLAAPLFVYLRSHPGVEQRLSMLDAPLQALAKGDASVLLERAWSAVGGLLLPGRGDSFLAYALPGRPVLDPLTGALFLTGLGLCLARWRQPAYAFALLWLVVGFSPTLITGATASTTRAVAALPVMFLLPALAAMTVIRWAERRWGTPIGWAARAGLAVLVFVTGARAAHTYFSTWGDSADVRAAYQHTIVAMARYLDAQPQGGSVAVASIYPSAPHDPYVMDIALWRDDLEQRWFDARRALLFPAQPTLRLIAPSSSSLDPYWAALPGLYLRERFTLRPDDLDPYFQVYEWETDMTLAALRERAQSAPLDMPLPVDFGGALELLGYELRTPVVAPGATVKVVSLWQVTDLKPLRSHDAAHLPDELVLFVHALDANSAVVGQEDRLDAPSWDWQPGDIIAQIHRFALPAELVPGTLALELGVYRRADLQRLPVRVDGSSVADRVLLQPVEVVAP
jgi:hypothetical protein